MTPVHIKDEFNPFRPKLPEASTVGEYSSISDRRMAIQQGPESAHAQHRHGRTMARGT
jgi:hypothetical protein